MEHHWMDQRMEAIHAVVTMPEAHSQQYKCLNKGDVWHNHIGDRSQPWERGITWAM
jgi:hypothetical protein